LLDSRVMSWSIHSENTKFILSGKLLSSSNCSQREKDTCINSG
jgi:hypothetical protein